MALLDLKIFVLNVFKANRKYGKLIIIFVYIYIP